MAEKQSAVVAVGEKVEGVRWVGSAVPVGRQEMLDLGFALKNYRYDT